MTWVVLGSTCGTGSDKGQLSHEGTDGTPNIYSEFYMWMHHHSQSNLTNHMRSQRMPAYILQDFWGFPALLFVILEMLFLNHFPAGLLWSSLESGSPGGAEVQPRAWQGPHPPKDVPFHTELLTFPGCRCCTLSREHIALVLVRCSHTSLPDEKDSLGDMNGNLSLLTIGKAAFGTWGFVLIFILKNSGPPRTSPGLFSHHLKNGAPWSDP